MLMKWVYLMNDRKTKTKSATVAKAFITVLKCVYVKKHENKKLLVIKKLKIPDVSGIEKEKPLGFS